MRTGNRIAILIFVIWLSVAATSLGASMTISVYENAPSPVRHAADRLARYTGIPVEEDSGGARSVRIELNATPNPRIGTQGYTIRSLDQNRIAIRGNNAEGVANGVYTFLRSLMIEHRKDPSSRKWEIEEKPSFSVRTIQVAPYRFGASYGFAALSPDRWSLEEWKEYVDLMRLCNMTTLCMASMRTYHPDYPHSEREKWRYEVWKEVMDYCHEVGLKFNWFISANQVAEQVFWDNLDKRAVQEPGNWWYGNGLAWNKGKELILKNQKYSLEFFRGLDGLEIIYSDGGGLSMDGATAENPAGYFADATRSFRELMRETGNTNHFVYWNWITDFWTKCMIPKATVQKYPKFKTLQDDVLPLLPKDVAWLDASLLTLIQTHPHLIHAAGNPPMREGLLIGKENGFKPVIDFFWYMNREVSLNLFPHPFIRRAIQESRYARDELGVGGVEGYRLAPPCRFLCDYVFFRVASDPSLTEEQLVTELAGLLCKNPENQQQVEQAIGLLERFWTTHSLEEIEKAERLFREALINEGAKHSKHLEYVSNGVTFLMHVVRMAQPDVTAAQKFKMKMRLYRTAREMYIFQGLTADVVWIPEAVRFFHARVEMMIQDYRSPFYQLCPYPEVVDRSIYPKATSQPFKLRWPKTTKRNRR